MTGGDVKYYTVDCSNLSEFFHGTAVETNDISHVAVRNCHINIARRIYLKSENIQKLGISSYTHERMNWGSDHDDSEEYIW